MIRHGIHFGVTRSYRVRFRIGFSRSLEIVAVLGERSGNLSGFITYHSAEPPGPHCDRLHPTFLEPAYDSVHEWRHLTRHIRPGFRLHPGAGPAAIWSRTRAGGHFSKLSSCQWVFLVPSTSAHSAGSLRLFWKRQFVFPSIPRRFPAT